MSLFKSPLQIFARPAQSPEAEARFVRHCHTVSSRRVRAGYVAMLLLLGLLIVAVDLPAYVTGALFDDPVMQQLFWWRVAFVVFISFLLSLNALIPKRDLHDAVFAWASVICLPLVGAAFCIICHPRVPDVSVYVLLVVAVAAVLPMASPAKLLIYPASLAWLIVGLAVFAYEPATFLHSTIIAGSGAVGALVIDMLARQGFAQDFAKSWLLMQRERRSGELVEEMFPGAIVEKLPDRKLPIVEQQDAVTVLFAEFAGFSTLTQTLSPTECMTLLDDLFNEFDEAAERFGVAKIKTSGDCYIAACGVEEAVENHAERAAELALRMRSIAQRFRADRDLPVHLRIGIHSGPVISGIIGRKRFGYDLWGATVNLASQLRALATLGGIHVSAATRDALGKGYSFSIRDPIRIKGRPPIQTYYLVGRAIDRDAAEQAPPPGAISDTAPAAAKEVIGFDKR